MLLGNKTREELFTKLNLDGVKTNKLQTTVESSLEQNIENLTGTRTMKNIIVRDKFQRKTQDKDFYLEGKDAYHYKIADVVENNLSTLKVKKGERINLCIYKVNNQSINPFLQYLLYKYPQGDTEYSDLLLFPFFKVTSGKDVIKECLDKANNMFDNIQLKTPIVIRGYIANQNGVSIFMEVKIVEDELSAFKRESKLWWVLIDEIINSRHVCNFPIHISVFDIFYDNTILLYLFDKEGNIYETPIASYYGDYYKMIEFIAVFGLKKASIYSSLGPFYYFGTYENAIRGGAWTMNYKPLEVDDEILTDNELGRFTKGGIVRFAVFLGRMKVLLNHPFDKEDDSNFTREKINDPKNDKQIIEDSNFVRLSLKLRDVDGNWVKNYDSVYVGRTLLENGQLYSHIPQWVCKNYEQQLPLSYHYIDKDTLSDKWHENNRKYYIK